MESVLMTSPGSSTRLRSRLRNAANALLARNPRNRQTGPKGTQAAIGHKNNRNAPSRTNNCSRVGTNCNIKQANFNRSVVVDSGGNREKRTDSDAVLNTNTANNRNNGISNSTRGKFTREVYSTICSRLGQTPHIPGDSVQKLFNDMHLYPSKSQVLEMLQCARQCGRRNGSTPFLTFGEFSVFARALQGPKSHRKTLQHRSNNKCMKKCDVFLGGSCNPTTWRTDIAIPELQKHNITYYNPQKSIWGPELVAEEHDAKQSASILFFVIDSQTRSVSGMIEVAFLVASKRCVVIVAHPYQLGQSIMGEELLYREYTDLVDGQSSLLALVKNQGEKVYSNLTAALQRTTNLLENWNTYGILPEEQVVGKLRLLRQIFDSYDINGTGELHLNDVLDAYYRLTNKTLQISELYQYLSSSNNDSKRNRISFEQFCTLVAEFSGDGCRNSLSDDWVRQPLSRQCVANCDIPSTNCSINDGHALKEKSKNETWLTDVYLGGSCKTQVNWREDIATPLLEKHGLTYYNPAVRETNCVNNINETDVNSYLTNGSVYLNDCESDERDCENSLLESSVLLHTKHIDASKIILFVITNDTRSLTSMILAAHYIAFDEKRVVLCVQQLPTEDCTICTEKLTKQAIKDYNRGRVYLSDLAHRKQVPVFSNLNDALDCVIKKCHNR